MMIRTERLELVAATVEMARADLHDRPLLQRLVGARVPDGWPPPLNDRQSMQYALDFLEADAGARGWMHWYVIRPESEGGPRTFIGMVGFKGKPAPDGTVEIGYTVMEDLQRQGYGTEAAGALIAWAFSHPEVRQVVAETYPELRASIRVMERNGMTFLGAGSEVGVVRYGITRARFEETRR